MTAFVPPHLPVVSELDNTRNWETLKVFLEEFESSAGGGTVPLFKSYVATEQEATAAKGAEPKVLATPDEVSFTLSEETLVLVSATFKCRTPGIGPTKCWLYLDNATALNEDGKAVKGEHNATELQQMNLLARENPASLISDNTTTVSSTKLDLGSFLPYWLAAGTHKFDLRFDGTIGGTFFKERRLVVLVPGVELKSTGSAEGAAGGDLTGTYPNPTIAAQEAFKTPSFENSWKATAGSEPGYMKDRMGFVHLRGRLESGASGKVAFTLPAGYRPGGGTSDLYAAGAVNGTTAIAAFMAIGTNGTVELYFAAAITTISVQATFKAEN